MAKPSSVHFVTLDLYRFIAASGVVALHFAEFTEHPSSEWLRYSTSQFYLFVDFFFILSGFVIARSYSDTLKASCDVVDYLRRRLARIYPLYFVTFVFFAIASLIGVSHYPDRSKAASMLSQLMMINSWPLNAPSPYNLPAWSISVEWAMYLLFPLMLLACRQLGWWILFLIIAIGFLANYRYINSGVLAAPLWSLNINPIRALPTFSIGVSIAIYIDRYAVPYGVAIGFFAFLISIGMMVDHANAYAVLFTFSISIFLTANGELQKPPTIFNNAICKALGDSSYSVYMLHIIVIMVTVDLFWKKITGNVEFPIIGFALLVFPLIVIFSILNYQVFERPLRNTIAG